jgi:cytochrome c oxidase subunit II
MDRLEKKLIYISLALMVLFTALVVYAGIGRGIVLPTSHEHLTPFTQGNVDFKDNNHFEIRVVARMWEFDPAEIILPEKADADFYVSALDVNHGFEVAGTNVNLMAVPGTVNTAHHRFDKPGEYVLICHEYCGLNHQKMFGKIRVVSSQEYKKLMQEMTARITTLGEKLSIQKDCASCHTSDGSESIGPTFKGMFGRKTKLADGGEVIIDEAYIIESIKYPDRQIVMNYDQGSMPETQITDEEIKELVDYIKTLK